MNHFAKIAEKLSAYELDGMLLTCEANRFYASGFHSTGTDGVALVTREGNFYFTDSRYIEAAHNKVQDAEIAMTDAAHPYVDLINAAMEKTHVQKLGFEDAYMTVADYRHYSEKLHCQLVPATELLISLRQSKDEEEIQRMIAAQRIAEGALDQIVKEIKPGVTEKEIAARLQYLMLAGGAENMSFDPIVASGPNGSMPHAVPTDRKIQDGDFVTMDFGCIYQGYCSDMTRTVAVGHVTEEMEKVYNVVLQAQLAGIAAANQNFVLARAGMQAPVLDVALMTPKQEVFLECNARNVMSVEVPVFTYQTRTSDANDIYSYGFAFTSSDLDAAVKSLADILPDMLRLAEVEKSCQLMAAEIEKTRRRVNALEHVMIPQMQANIKYITMKLDENERSTQIRLMKVKDMMLEQAHHYSEHVPEPA